MLTLFIISFNPFYFIHYSDPQIGRNAYAFPYCTLAVNQISRMRPAPDFILVAGDMADNPTVPAIVQSQWRTCDSLFDLLPMAKYYTPGNNDLGYANEACWTPAQLALYRGFWGPDYYALDRDSCHFVCLNSTLLDTYSGHACYQYSLEQDSFLRADLAGIAPGEYRHRILFFHFPLYVSSPAEANSGSNVDRPRRDTLLAALVSRCFISVLTGHLHYDLMNLYGPSLLESGLATCETGMGSCGYRPVKVFADGIETYAIWLAAPSDTLPMVQIVRPGIAPDTAGPGQPVSFTCLVDSANFPDWRGLTYRWQFGDGQASSSANTSHAYADTGHYSVTFAAYKSPHLGALYHYRVVVGTGQEAAESRIPGARLVDLEVSPNPFGDRTTITPGIGHRAEGGELLIYDISGRMVRSFTLSSMLSALSWDGRDENGFSVPEGVYFARLESGGRAGTEKIVKIR